MADAATAPRLGKKERTRREIYRTAMQLFGEHGYDGVTIEDICAGAGIAKATFFLHFRNKAALLLAFNEEITTALAEKLSQNDGSSAEEQLRFMADVFGEAYHSNAQVMRRLLTEFLEQPASYQMAREANESLIALVANIVRQGQKRGEFRKGFLPELAALSIVATWSALIAFWLENPDIETESSGNAFLDIAMNGLKAG
ncbi:AcrR family transcriptional regulator [Parvibaculum indicum]|uniref:TetR/AcrR family transcriptional regulator n=1 Tax=Parvibaculum indicum TaxID=562969 RepID=UPI0014235B47|nr:TetR/AcrR family transcriptional regulator [Parvibaculum indicum]NIJ42393.1 AcrR family transcriptional regulator [Parvibaculum indicum]